jgi:hypothetical protein
MMMSKIRNIFFWMALALVVAGIFVAQVWKQNNYVELKRNFASSGVLMEKLKSDIAGIQLDSKKLMDYKRLEKLAKKKFGLVYAGPPEFIYTDKETYKHVMSASLGVLKR